MSTSINQLYIKLVADPDRPIKIKELPDGLEWQCYLAFNSTRAFLNLTFLHILEFLVSSRYENQSYFSKGKSFFEALILASTNPQYDKRLFIELRVQYMKTTNSVHVVYINCSECQNKKQFMFTTCSELVIFMY